MKWALLGSALLASSLLPLRVRADLADTKIAFHVQEAGPSASFDCDGADTLSIVGYPNTGLIKATNCDAAEIVLDMELTDGQVGWVSMGGAAREGDCNPALEPCAETPINVTPTTWSAIKAGHGPDAKPWCEKGRPL